MNCVICGTEFEPKRRSAKYCSSRCRKLAFLGGPIDPGVTVPWSGVVSVPNDTKNGKTVDSVPVSVPSKWRKLSAHKDGGYWVLPGTCKWGECLNPKCQFHTDKSTRAVQVPTGTIMHEPVYGTVDEPDKTWDRVCVLCHKPFNTPLEFMRFCSPECKRDVMINIASPAGL